MNYGMFSKAGNQRVQRLLREAQLHGWSFEKLDRHLTLLSKVPEFSEATDTVVREAVYAEFVKDYS
jgi:hypothetical protein